MLEQEFIPATGRQQMNQFAWAVLLAGGEGMRLRPLTRFLSGEDQPKQFCRLYGGRTLLAQTRARLARVIAPERTLFAVLKAHEKFYSGELAEAPPSHLVVQPRNRGTTPAIAAALLRIMRLAGDPVVGFFPTDHFYSNEEKFLDSVRRALGVAQARRDMLMLLGAEPEHAEVEYGWIEPAAGPAPADFPAPVKRFWEKPSEPVARSLLERGCLWNTFVMIGRATAFLEALETTVPELLRAFGMSTDTPERMEAVYSSIPFGDFSSQVLACRTEKLGVLRVEDAGWNDLGTPERVMESIRKMPQFASR